MFSEKCFHRLVILLTVRVLIVSGLYAAETTEPMMYKLRRGSDLEIRHLIHIEPCQSIAQLKEFIVNAMKKTSYPAQKDDNLKVDLYYKSVFDSKYRLARMTRGSFENKAKVQLFMAVLKRCLNETSGVENVHLANQKKRAS